jgi:hypothetical protein
VSHFLSGLFFLQPGADSNLPALKQVAHGTGNQWFIGDDFHHNGACLFMMACVFTFYPY